MAQYTFVFSLTDPGVYNWLDTAGLREGTFMVHWQGLPATSSSSTKPPSLTAQVVQPFQLISVLPSETRYVTPEERKEQLGERAVGYALRVGGLIFINVGHAQDGTMKNIYPFCDVVSWNFAYKVQYR